MNAYKVFTVDSEEVTEGARVEMHELSGGVKIRAILVGQEGRGRSLGVLLVSSIPEVPCPNRIYKDTGNPHHVSKHTNGEPGEQPNYIHKCEHCGVVYSPWRVFKMSGKPGSAWVSRHPKDSGTLEPKLFFAEVSEGKVGRAKLVGATASNSQDYAIVVMRTKIGFRGGNDHTGDRDTPNFKLNSRGREKLEALSNSRVSEALDGFLSHPAYSLEEKEQFAELFRLDEEDFDVVLNFKPFPGKVLVKGVIAQGTAGGMGSGDQLVAVVKKGEIFRTSYSGRLYGAPSAHYYLFDGEKIRVATWDERELTGDMVFEM